MSKSENVQTPGRTKTAPPPIVHIEPHYLAKPQVAAFLSISETTIDLLVAKGDMPRPRKLSGGRVAWLVAELRAWGNERPVSDLLPPKNSGYGRAGARQANTQA